MKLKQYPEYKDSGLPWVEKIPSHWDIKRNKYILFESNERSVTGDEDLLTVSQYTGVTKRKDKIVDKKRLLTNAESLVGYRLAKPNDIVMNIMLAWNGSLGVSNHYGIVSPAYCVYRPKGHIESKYFHYLFRTPIFTGLFKTYSTGIVESRLRLYSDVFFRLNSIIPSESEQKQIVKFLDSKCARIVKFIRNKRRLIQLLKEQKQIIINQAVTRGISPNVKMKPSGVDWIGDIPKDWEARRLKYLIKGMLQYGANETSGFQEEGDPRYVRITDINSDGLLEDETFCTISSDLAKPYILEEGDILFARSGATVGKTFCYRNEWGLSAYAGYLIRAKIDRKIISHEYLYLFTKSNAYLNWISSSFIKATIQNISAEKYASLWITLPPRKEQDAILLHIQKLTKPVELAISRVMREIDLIQEYRTRLISDVVTGKVDVRNIKVEDVSDEELIDDLFPTEEIKEPEDSVEEVPDED